MGPRNLAFNSKEIGVLIFKLPPPPLQMASCSHRTGRRSDPTTGLVKEVLCPWLDCYPVDH